MSITARPLATDAPRGTLVFVVEDVGTGVTLTRTRSESWNVCEHMSVLLVGRTGGFKLDRCFDATESLGGTDAHELGVEEGRAIAETELDILRGHARTWPLVDVLRRLKSAAEHALSAHNCDHHGHEGDKYAAEEAAHYIALLETD